MITHAGAERQRGAERGGCACRRERRRAQGLPEDLTPEEQEEERKKAEADMARQTRAHLPVKPVTRINKMRDVLVQMKKTTDDQVRPRPLPSPQGYASGAAGPHSHRRRRVRTHKDRHPSR